MVGHLDGQQRGTTFEKHVAPPAAAPQKAECKVAKVVKAVQCGRLHGTPDFIAEVNIQEAMKRNR